MHAPSLGYLVFPVENPVETAAFWVRAFACRVKFTHESGGYVELDTGATTLGFASDALMAMNGVPYRKNRATELSGGAIVSLVTPEPEALFAHALTQGAREVHAVVTKPWGQRSGFVADPNGLLVEVCSPIG
jgi:uncharacterized glyoxalase superfamily protein PhnB